MKLRMLTVSVVCVVFAMVFALSAFAQELKPIKLPEPKLDANKSLAQALKERKTTREYAGASLSEQTLSNLLWAAFGINRPDSGKRTAPSALNWQEIDIYVSTTQGIYLYDPKGNDLIPVASGDLRSLTYTQVERFKDAPVNLVYVADMEKTGAEDARKNLLVAMDTGFVAENVYLYCATEGLPTGFRVSIPKEKLGQALKLRPTQMIMGAQSVGLPKNK
ncbi:MAG: SagB/ThcOx family dehydrogenase [Desulfomonilaceae bacterium]